MIIKSKVGLFIAGSDPIFDAHATAAIAKLNLNYDFLGGTGFGATCAAYLAANCTDKLITYLPGLLMNPKKQNLFEKIFANSPSKQVDRYAPFILSLDTVKLRSSEAPIIVPSMSTQKFKPEVLDLRRVGDNDLLIDILKANQTLPDAESCDRLAFDGGILNVYDPLMAMINAGAERIILVTSALPISTNETVLSQAFRTIQHNELLRALCMCQAQLATLQVHLVAPAAPCLASDTKADLATKFDFEKKQAVAVVQDKLANFNIMPPDPSQTGWAAVMALTSLGDRFLTSTGIDLFMHRQKENAR